MRDLYQRLSHWEELYETQRNLVANPLTPSEQEVEHRKLVGFNMNLAGLFLKQATWSGRKRYSAE